MENKKEKPDREIRLSFLRDAGPTGLEPATSALTGQRSNQLSYDPVTVTQWTQAGSNR